MNVLIGAGVESSLDAPSANLRTVNFGSAPTAAQGPSALSVGGAQVIAGALFSYSFGGQ